MIQSIYNDVDDIPSWFKSQNYFTMYVSPSPLNFDGKTNWLLRGRKPKKAEKIVGRFPLWNDKIYMYYPKPEELGDLQVEQGDVKSWVPDRIGSAETVYWFEQNKKANPDKSIFAFWATVETHMPFYGQDSRKFYDPYAIGKGLDSGEKMPEKKDRYATMAKYTDHYISQVIENITRIDNNTIFFITGDHGAREVPLYDDTNVIDKYDTDSPLFDQSCVRKPFANDELFDTTGLIVYRGDDPELRALFDQYKNKVIKTPTDHQDLVRTAYELAELKTHRKLPGQRNGRNLFELAENITKNNELRSHVSIRFTQMHTEIATETEFSRFHSLSPVGEQFNGLYPSCIITPGKSRQPLDRDWYDDHVKLIELTNYLQRNNKAFNYAFRNSSCTYPTKC